MYVYHIYTLHIYTCWWVTGYMTQSARIQSAKSDLQSLLLCFLGGEGNEVEGQANVALWQPWHLIHLLPDFQQSFSVPSSWISWPPRSCLNPNWGNVFDGLDCFQRKWLVRKVAHAYCDFEDLLWHPDAKETQVNRKSPWLLGLGIFEKWPKRSTCKWKKHDQCNRSMGFDWHVNVISGF